MSLVGEPLLVSLLQTKLNGLLPLLSKLTNRVLQQPPATVTMATNAGDSHFCHVPFYIHLYFICVSNPVCLCSLLVQYLHHELCPCSVEYVRGVNPSDVGGMLYSFYRLPPSRQRGAI